MGLVNKGLVTEKNVDSHTACMIWQIFKRRTSILIADEHDLEGLSAIVTSASLSS